MLGPAGTRFCAHLCSEGPGACLKSRSRIVKCHYCMLPILAAAGKALGPWTADVLPHLGSSLPQVRDIRQPPSLWPCARQLWLPPSWATPVWNQGL